ncbi:MAG: hypothetical protein GX945_13925 [Lentisphaerae bacterium]|nr:hypothetical protein [Lentisphaerota bacterium]
MFYYNSLFRCRLGLAAIFLFGGGFDRTFLGSRAGFSALFARFGASAFAIFAPLWAGDFALAAAIGGPHGAALFLCAATGGPHGAAFPGFSGFHDTGAFFSLSGAAAAPFRFLGEYAHCQQRQGRQCNHHYAAFFTHAHYCRVSVCCLCQLIVKKRQENVIGHPLILVTPVVFSAVVPLQGTTSWGAHHPSLKAGVKHG